MRKLWLAVVLITAASLAGCTDSPGTKAGGNAPPLTLRLAAMEGAHSPDADALTTFADRVRDVSGGAVQVQIEWNAATATFGSFGPQAEEQVAGLVQAGKVDLAQIPSRAWDELGVTSLRALQAPFLIDSEELLDKVAGAPMATQMLGALDTKGVVGLALIPAGLRHPIGFARPLLSLSDFSGAQIRTLTSKTSFQTVSALGAVPVVPDDDAFRVGAINGQIAGAESGFAWGGDLPRLGTFTANITLFPKVDTLVVNARRFGKLSRHQQTVLRDAAMWTVGQLAAGTGAEMAAAKAYCTLGGGVAMAKPTDLAQLQAAAASVYQGLEQDAQTKVFIEAIRALKANTPPAPQPQTCAMGSGVPGAGASSPGTAQFPAGIYRAEFTYEFLAARGITGDTADGITGISTLTIKDGHWVHNLPPGADCGGEYTVADNRISFSLGESCGGTGFSILFSANWKLAKGELRFFNLQSNTDTQQFIDAFWGGQPWKKIG